MCRNMANTINFRYILNSEKTITKFFNRFKKHYVRPIFSPISSILRKTQFLLKNLVVTHNLIWVSNTLSNFKKKIMIWFQKNVGTSWIERRANKGMDEQQDGEKDGQTHLLYRSLLLLSGIQLKTCIDVSRGI